MIISRLIGGLGNQLFQYAFGFRLARELSTELMLDITPFQTYKLHHYALDNFAIEQRLASADMVDEIHRFRARPPIFRFFDRSRRILEERGMQYMRRYVVFKPAGQVYLHGYWQSFRYFESVEKELRKTLQLRSELSERDLKILAQLKSLGRVGSIHVRRSDYITNPAANQIHGSCALSYYSSAAELLKETRGISTYLVFSDDSAWVREHFKIKANLIIVDHNGPMRNFADLYLMAACDSNIIANSSFSWWAAWLNHNKAKVVIAPRHWYADKRLNGQTADLVPPDWVRI
jgi:hypothetical protein